MTSSEGGGLHAYAALLRRPHVARFLLGGVIIQFPYAMVNMALLIGARDGFGTVVGFALAALALAVVSMPSVRGALRRSPDLRLGDEGAER